MKNFLYIFLYDHDCNSTKHIRVTYHRTTVMISLEENRKEDTLFGYSLFACPPGAYLSRSHSSILSSTFAPSSASLGSTLLALSFLQKHESSTERHALSFSLWYAVGHKVATPLSLSTY